jgi:hypothetical protein
MSELKDIIDRQLKYYIGLKAPNCDCNSALTFRGITDNHYDLYCSDCKVSYNVSDYIQNEINKCGG